MAAKTNDSGTAGPACRAAARPVSTKMPAPMIAPIPSIVRFSAPSVRFSDRSPVASASARSAVMDLVAQSPVPPPEVNGRGGGALFTSGTLIGSLVWRIGTDSGQAEAAGAASRTVVRRLARDGHVVRMRFPESGRRHLDHLDVALER